MFFAALDAGEQNSLQLVTVTCMHGKPRVIAVYKRLPPVRLQTSRAKCKFTETINTHRPVGFYKPLNGNRFQRHTCDLFVTARERLRANRRYRRRTNG